VTPSLCKQLRDKTGEKAHSSISASKINAYETYLPAKTFPFLIILCRFGRPSRISSFTDATGAACISFDVAPSPSFLDSSLVTAAQDNYLRVTGCAIGKYAFLGTRNRNTSWTNQGFGVLPEAGKPPTFISGHEERIDHGFKARLL